MKRLVLVAGVCALVVFAAGMALAIYLAAHPWTGAPIASQEPFTVFMRGLASTVTAPVLTIGLAAVVAVVFALAVQWNRSHPDSGIRR